MEINRAEFHKTTERIFLAIGAGDGAPKRYVLNRVKFAPFYNEVYSQMLQSGQIWERGTGKRGDPVMVASQRNYPNPNPVPAEPELPTERDALLDDIKSGGLGFILDIGYPDWLRFRMALKDRGKSGQTVLAYLIKEWSDGRL